MAGEPKFFTRNYVDRLSTLSLNPAGGPTTAALPRLFDRDSELRWVSSGAASDATTVELTVEFRSGGVAITRTIDTIVVLGHNLKDVTFRYWDGAAWQPIPGGGFVGLTGTTLIFALGAPIATQRIRVDMVSTQPVANQEKRVGELMAMAGVYTPPTDQGPEGMGFTIAPTALLTEMMDDGLSVHQLRWAGNRVDRYRARMRWVLIPQAVLDGLVALTRRGQFVAQPEPVEKPGEFYLVTAIASVIPFGYETTFKGNGYGLDLDLREV